MIRYALLRIVYSTLKHVGDKFILLFDLLACYLLFVSLFGKLHIDYRYLTALISMLSCEYHCRLLGTNGLHCFLILYCSLLIFDKIADILCLILFFYLFADHNTATLHIPVTIAKICSIVYIMLLLAFLLPRPFISYAVFVIFLFEYSCWLYFWLLLGIGTFI